MNIYESASKKIVLHRRERPYYFNDKPELTGAIFSSFNDSHTPEQFDEMIKRHGWTLQEPKEVTVWQITKADALKAVGVTLAFAALFIGIMAL